MQRFWAACSASGGPVDGRLDVHYRRAVDCLQRVDFDPKPVARRDAGTVQADGFGRLVEQVLNTPVSGRLMSSSERVLSSSWGERWSQVSTTILSLGRRYLAPSATPSSKRIHAPGLTCGSEYAH